MPYRWGQAPACWRKMRNSMVSVCKQANLPDIIFFDTMHNVCASGGFAQYEANQFCRQVKEHGFPMEMLDSWYSCIRSPRQGFAKLSKHWFSVRVSDASDGSQRRAYASEMLTVVSVLSCFADEWLTPQGFMPAEICCLKKLKPAMKPMEALIWS